MTELPALAGTARTTRIAVGGMTVAVLTATIVAFSTGTVERIGGAFRAELAVSEPIQVEVGERDRRVVCAGPLLGYIPQDVEPRAFGAPDLFGLQGDVTTVASPGLLNQLGEENPGDVALSVVSVPPEAEGAASSIQRWSTETLRGLAVAPCQEARAETWLVGGSTTTGRQAVLSLANPGDVPASVDVRVFGASGEIDAPGARGILLPPQTRRVVGLAGFAPDEPSPVIHVTSSSVPVVATLHLQVTRGLQADGMAIVWGGATAAPSIAIPGVWLEQGEVASTLRASEGYEDLGAALRVLSPESDTTARITVQRALLGDVVSEVSLMAGRVVDVALDQLGSAVVAVTVEADQPIVAGIRQSTAELDRTDVSWIAAQEAWSGTAAVWVPPGPEATLSVIGRSEGPSSLTVDRLAPDGVTVLARSTLDVSTDRVGSVVVGPNGGLYRLVTEGNVSAAVVLREPGGIGHLGVALPAPSPEPVRVLTR